MYVYEGIEHSTIVLAPSFSTKFKAVPHVHGCIAIANDGVTPMRNRYAEIHPGQTYGAGFLQLSVQDVMTAAGTGMNYSGGEGTCTPRCRPAWFLNRAESVSTISYLYNGFFWISSLFFTFHFIVLFSRSSCVEYSLVHPSLPPVRNTFFFGQS